MILILGGTTEGRLAVRTLDQAAKPYYYSTLEQWQQVDCAHGIRLNGGMDERQMISFCREKGIKLLVDAAHPFATQLHHNIEKTASELNIPVVRVERQYPELPPHAILCKDFEDAVLHLKQYGIKRLLALTGVKTISRLKEFWKENDNCWFRVLNREDSVQMALAQGFPQDRLVFYQTDNTAQLISYLNPDAIITKESGKSGGFDEKSLAAQKANIPMFVVKRPELPASFLCVSGEYSLRKEVERCVPGFFDQRIGFTTGACATAATKAAVLTLLNGVAPETVSISLPNNETITIDVSSVSIDNGKVSVEVIKDAGDDPDVTNGSIIISTVSWVDDTYIHFLQGKGVGKVTLPGIGVPVGEPAINPTPRSMMQNEIRKLTNRGVNITISVPGGEELALRTFNPKLGIVNGISIIGTLGIVRPFSSEAFIEAIRCEVEVAKAIGIEHLIINSGAKSERMLKCFFPEFPPQAFVHYGNFIGETLKIAHELNIPRVTMGIMIGKAVKLAEGHLNTHSKTVVMNKEFLKQLANDAGCSLVAQDAIMNMVLARELWKSLSAEDFTLFKGKLLDCCYRTCNTCYSNGKLEIILIEENSNLSTNFTN